MRIRKRRFRLALLPVVILAMMLPLATGVMAATGDVYDDSLHWANWSWGSTINPNSTSHVQSGSKSMAVTYHKAWAGASFWAGSSVNASGASVKFSVYANGKLPNLAVAVYDGAGQRTNNVKIAGYASAGNGGWYHVSVPMSVLGPRDGSVKRLTVQDQSGRAQSTFWIDNLRISGSGDTAVKPAAPKTSPSTSSSSSTTVARPTGSFKPGPAPQWIDEIIRDMVAKYNLPRWFYYAIVQRESYFNPNLVNSKGYDLGLTQLGSVNYYGELYPMNLSKPNNNHQQYGWDMNFGKYGMWLRMDQVSQMTNPFDARQNLERFSTGYAVPAFNLFKKYYGQGDTETLRRVAFHWNKGLYLTYDPGNQDYLGLYDKIVNEYKPKVEAQDGKWNGSPRIP